MSLQEDLSILKAQNLAQIPEESKNIMFADLKKISGSGIVEAAPKVGEKLKDFSLSNHLGEFRNLAELRAKGPVVITFYRGGWCPYCNLELQAYQKVLNDIKAAGATLIAITPELPDASLTTAERHNLEFEVLTDIDSNYARELGIVFTLAEELRPVYASFGIEIEKHNGKNQYNIPLPATFVVASNGIISKAFVNADYTLRADPVDIVEELKTLMK